MSPLENGVGVEPRYELPKPLLEASDHLTELISQERAYVDGLEEQRQGLLNQAEGLLRLGREHQAILESLQAAMRGIAEALSEAEQRRAEENQKPQSDPFSGGFRRPAHG